MKIIIGGAGAVGKHLAQLFSREHHDITILDENPAKYENLIANYDLMGRAVSPTSIDGLKSVGVKDADLVIGVTTDETANLTCCMLDSKMGNSQFCVTKLDQATMGSRKRSTCVDGYQGQTELQNP